MEDFADFQSSFIETVSFMHCNMGRSNDNVARQLPDVELMNRLDFADL